MIGRAPKKGVWRSHRPHRNRPRHRKRPSCPHPLPWLPCKRLPRHLHRKRLPSRRPRNGSKFFVRRSSIRGPKRACKKSRRANVDDDKPRRKERLGCAHGRCSTRTKTFFSRRHRPSTKCLARSTTRRSSWEARVWRSRPPCLPSRARVRPRRLHCRHVRLRQLPRECDRRRCQPPPQLPRHRRPPLPPHRQSRLRRRRPRSRLRPWPQFLRRRRRPRARRLRRRRRPRVHRPHRHLLRRCRPEVHRPRRHLLRRRCRRKFPPLRRKTPKKMDPRLRAS